MSDAFPPDHEGGPASAGDAPHAGAPPHEDPGAAAYVEAWEHQAARSGAVAPRRRPLRFVRELVQTVFLTALMFFATQTVVQGREVVGPSMQPNYHQGERLFVNRAVYARVDMDGLSRVLPFLPSDQGVRYLFHAPRRGEVVVFTPPFKSQDDLIKRVVGVPGDRVVVKDGAVSVNGRRIDERYLPNIRTSCGGRWCDVTLGPDQYYVMGDNRPNSSDSRMWGPIAGGAIVGKAWLISFPLSEFGRAP